MAEKPIRVLIVDDHAVVRKGIRALLDTEGDIDVIGEAEDGQKAVQAYFSLKPASHTGPETNLEQSTPGSCYRLLIFPAI